MTKGEHSRRLLLSAGAAAALLAGGLAPVAGPALAQSLSQQQSLEAARSWGYSAAIQAGVWGAPLVTMYALRHNDAVGPKPKAKPNEIWRMEDISTPELSKEAGYVTPNVNVVYGFGFVDLRQGPVVLEAPDSDGRYYMVEIVDMWTNAFAYVGGKATGYKGGRFVLVGPDWTGDLPADAKAIRCPTPWVLIQPRVHIYRDGKIDLAGARKVLDAIRLVPPAGKSGSYGFPAPEFVDPNLPVSALDFKDPLQFWELLSVALNENPPPKDQITALLPMFKPLGIELGKPWDRSKVRPPVLAAMAEATKALPNLLAKLPLGTLVNYALIPPPSIGDFGTDYLNRAFIGRNGLTANTPYEAIYWGYTLDDKGAGLEGGNRYTLTFREGIPFLPPGFWSVTLYSSENNYTVPNPINRYMVGSDTGLKRNADGSITIYIQADSPGADKDSNWLPSPKSGRFYLIPRVYAPAPKAIEDFTHPTPASVPAVVKVP
ncbi:Uncharacterized conserved protein [Enhydrobacter aerosaccus]|uniref:Uncharacterized conserved protein n=1 Tax=Enhydrobacter aerosaccus TaxID=225324 RepID=A0A1T4TD26_9HYPH|nr:DUF1254 domain-containing protein [Enhydrobacter aerosaccus]SKA38231.1 Uncharacterized conserved protein [Enhydrobacter aerosaccus]